MTYAVNATTAVPSPGNMFLSGQASAQHSLVPLRRLRARAWLAHTTGTYRNIARLEKMGDLRHASRAAHGSRYNGPGIYEGVSQLG